MGADFQAVKDLTCLSDLMAEAGIEITRSGMTRCFMHNDRTPSLKIYSDQGRWWCFSCQRGGDIFDFCECFYNMGRRESLAYLGHRAGIEVGRRLTSEKRREIVERQKRRERKKQFLAWLDGEIFEIGNLLRFCDRQADMITPGSLGDEWSRFILYSRDYLEQLFDYLMGLNRDVKRI